MAIRFTQTPTPSVTATPSLTPSNTPTNTPTGTVCPGLTPTASPSNTPNPTSTLTATVTPTNTSTPTNTPTNTSTPQTTPTPTPTSGTTGCECYWILNETGGALNYNYTICGGTYDVYVINGGASAYVCSEDVPTGDGGITITACDVSCTTTCEPCA